LVEDVVKIHLCLHGDIFQLPDVYGGGGGTGAAVGEGKGTGAPPGRGGAGEVGDASFGRDGADVCGARGFDRSVAVNGKNILPVCVGCSFSHAEEDVCSGCVVDSCDQRAGSVSLQAVADRAGVGAKMVVESHSE